MGGFDDPRPAGGGGDVEAMEQLLPQADGHQVGERDRPAAMPDDHLIASTVGCDVKHPVDCVLEEPGQGGGIGFGDVGDPCRVLGGQCVAGETRDGRPHPGGDAGAQGRPRQQVSTSLPDSPVRTRNGDVEVG